jgi:uncharacterized protein DUF5906
MNRAKTQAANKLTLAHNKAMAEEFLAGLDPNAEKFAFQFISDGPDRKRTRIFYITFEEAWLVVQERNTPAHRVSVFVVAVGLADRRPRPCALLAGANDAEQIKRALATIKACDAKPDMIVEDRGRLRIFYPCPDIPLDQFPTLQRALSVKLGTDDPTVTDLSRVRLPGTLNFEDPANPRLVKLFRNGTSENWKLDGLLDKLGLQQAGLPSATIEQPDEPNADGVKQGVASDIDTRTVMVTFFPNKSAQSQRCVDLTLPQLAEQIRLKTGPSKSELPWLKLAIFGNKRSGKNCLRTNANAEQITGIEVEHDKGEIAFDAAIAVLRTASLRALFYTSPSYVPATKERWRILLPLSQNHPPETRKILVARINGLFGGKLADESFVLSQAYLYGSVNDNPTHRVEVIDGDFIDLRTDLDPGAMGKNSTGKDAKPRRKGADAPTPGGFAEALKTLKLPNLGEGIPPGSRTDAEIMALLALSQREHEWHNAMLSATASMVGRGWTNDRIYKTCAPYCRGGEGDSDVAEMVESARAKWNIPDGATVERLARLTLLEYDQQRKGAAKALGVRGPTLDIMVGACRTRDQAEDVDGEIAEINADHALVLAGNKAAVMKFEGKTKFRLLQVGAFQQWFANQSVMVGRKPITLGDYWLGHTQRRQYDGIEFAPPGSAVRPGHYNLFQGFAVEPKPGDCSKFLAHLKDNAARGDEKTFLWIVGWWAQIFKQPSIKMETALVIRGPFGAGKTKIGKVIGSLIGDHYLLVASPRYITGQFNSHMASLLVLHADEAFWAGDKASVGTLRDLVSGDHHMLEYKNVDPINIKNHVRLYVSGNPDWMVPAGFKERRWAVFDIGENHVQDKPYFAAT